MKKNPIPILGFAVISVHVLCVIWFNLPIVMNIKLQTVVYGYFYCNCIDSF